VDERVVEQRGVGAVAGRAVVDRDQREAFALERLEQHDFEFDRLAGLDKRRCCARVHAFGEHPADTVLQHAG
jgi:hypothetical protein